MTFCRQDVVPIQSLAKLIGHLVASLPGVLFATIFIRRLEILKIKSLAKNPKGTYGICIRLTDEVKADIQCWIDHITESAYPVRVLNLQFLLKQMPLKQEGGGEFVIVDELEIPGQPKRL